MRLLITPQEVGLLARPCNADNSIMEPLIMEAMREEIKPRIGDALYIDLTEPETEEGLSQELRFLLNGGTWNDASGKRRYLTGLKTALAYFVYARVIRDGNIQSTRYGARIKTDENSYDAETAERQRQYRQAFSSADGYLIECLSYINTKHSEYGCGHRVMKSNRTRIRVIGDTPGTPSCSKPAPSGVAYPEFMTSAEIAALFNK